MGAMNTPLLNRPQFGAGCAAYGLSLPATGAMISGAQAQAPAARTVKFPDGTIVPALGQGSWHLGQGRHPIDMEVEAMRTGIGLGLTVIDTAESYGEGKSEKFIGKAIAGLRERVFLVSKVSESTVVEREIERACDRSLARLGTNYLDLYLLHSPVANSYNPYVVAAFEKLRAAGKIRNWGVSNHDVRQMELVFKVPDGTKCATNQVPYALNNRYPEPEILPWCVAHNMPIMAYSPLGGDKRSLVGDKTLEQLGAQHGVPATAVALAWVIRSGNVIAIPESGDPAHVKENAAALSINWIPATP
jgi:diketogulonate reductase-like aldo/keto reductase